MSQDISQQLIDLERRVETLEIEEAKRKHLIVSVQEYSEAFARLISEELKRMSIPRGMA